MNGETITLAEGLKLTIDRAGRGDGGPILLLPAMGVPADYYDHFATRVVELGHSLVRVHWRDEDREFPRAHPDYGFKAIAERDVPAAAAWTREHFGADPVVLGHSLGGQLTVISEARGGPFAAMILLAAGTNYWRVSGLRWAPLLWLINFVTVPLITRIFGFWPGGRFGFGGRQSARLMFDWTRLGRTGSFRPQGASLSHEAHLKTIELPVLAVSVAGDRYISRGAMAHLTGKLTRCDVEHRHWRASEHRFRGHFNWVRAPHGPAELIGEWLSGLPGAAEDAARPDPR